MSRTKDLSLFSFTLRPVMQAFQKYNCEPRAVHEMQVIFHGRGILGEWTKIKRNKNLKIQIIFALKQKIAEL